MGDAGDFRPGVGEGVFGLGRGQDRRDRCGRGHLRGQSKSGGRSTEQKRGTTGGKK